MLAHQDDELVISPRIARDVAAGHRIHCVFLTDGAGHGADPARREAESRRALASLGVDPAGVFFPGVELGLPDGRLPEHLGTALRALEETVGHLPIRRIYTLAYEGGHQDHDAVHLLALAFARARGLLRRTWQAPIYHGHRRPGMLFRVAAPLRRGRGVLHRRLGLAEGVRHTLFVRHYPSQWRTWAALLPGLAWARAVRRHEWLLPVDPTAVLARPHAGPLLYERLFGFDYEAFREAAERELASELRLLGEMAS